ncbi:hypothetical protein ACA910_011216 [Epithemia clementina (nom. ined.)]
MPKLKLSTIYGRDSFCERALTASEACVIWDVPGTASMQWTDSMKTTLSRNLTTPVKVAAALGRCILSAIRRSHADGKRPRAPDLHDTEPENNAGQPGPVPRKKRRRQTTEEAHEETLAYTGQAVTRMQGYKPAPDLEDTATKSAVKNNKAEAPVYLWNDWVCYLLNLDVLGPHHLRAFDLLRRAFSNGERAMYTGHGKLGGKTIKCQSHYDTLSGESYCE